MMVNNLLPIAVAFGVSFLLSSLTICPVFRFAVRRGIVDRPNARKLHRSPVPLMGGLVVYIGLLCGMLSLTLIGEGGSVLPLEALLLLLAMLVVGIWDDVRELSPWTRLVAETVCVAMMMLLHGYSINNLHGLFGVGLLSPALAWPFTLLCCVGLINAFNFVDGVDGLASGLAIVMLILLGYFKYRCGDYARAAVAAAAVGGLVRFFANNVFGRERKMFLGDGGTMMVGLLFCDIVVSILSDSAVDCVQPLSARFGWAAFVLSVFSVTLFDSVRVVVGRAVRGYSPVTADKTHLHHAFIRYGFNHLETSLLEILLNISCVGVWWMGCKMGLSADWQFVVVVLYGFGSTYGLFVWLTYSAKKLNRR